MMSLRDQVLTLHATMEMYSHAKRFNERWLADPAFRIGLFRDPAKTLADYGLPVDTEEVQGIVAGDTERAGSIARGIYAITAMKSTLMDRWYGAEATPTDHRFAAWRSRQQARMLLELGPFQAKASVRAAWSAELTHGCSGGCWFCNMAAPELSGVAPAAERDLEEWHAILRTLKKPLGPAMRTGFLDGATDPFDHLSYESFCRIVLEEADFFPPTSTALSLRDPERSRRFFAEAKAAACWSVRLTVRDQTELNAVHATFSSDELAHVQLNALTPESSFAYSLTGRFRERFLSDPAFAVQQRRSLAFAPWYTRSADYADDDTYPIDASTGVVGFTLDMVQRTVSLRAPRPSSDALPLGFETLDCLPFRDSDELGENLNLMISRWMKPRLDDDDHVAFWQGIRREEIADGVRLHGRFRQYTDVIDLEHGAIVRRIAAQLERGTTVAKILQIDDDVRDTARNILQRFFDQGLLEEPRLHD